MAAGGGHTVKISNYTVFKDDRIGRGAFGTVYGARHEDGRVLAVKEIDVQHNKRAAIQEAMSFYKQPRIHENIIQIFEISRPEPQYDLYVFMEFCAHGNLDNYFATYYKSLKQVRPKLLIMRQVANGISHLHEQAITHRDIKPANVLISGSHLPEQCVVKITDFGLAKYFDPEGDTSAMSTDVGTMAFKAPEFYLKGPNDNIHYNKSVDVYAAGLAMQHFWQ